jgi:hypothetical protein
MSFAVSPQRASCVLTSDLVNSNPSGWVDPERPFIGNFGGGADLPLLAVQRPSSLNTSRVIVEGRSTTRSGPLPDWFIVSR